MKEVTTCYVDDITI